MKKVIVAGGAGYIGSHTMIELVQSGFLPVCIDNLSNSSAEAVKRAGQIAGMDIPFYRTDLLDANAVSDIFEKEKPEAVIMLAGFKAVGESVQKPFMYYRNNLDSLLNICEAMKKSGCRNIIFSSSATVYGTPKSVPLSESAPEGELTSPYGRTKSFIEKILIDLHTADPEFQVIILRYFNPIGAHPSGLIGEDPQGIPNNLVPYIAQTAAGVRREIHVFGDDYDTPDGTGVRDYIHVVDLARGHVSALKKFSENPGLRIINLGTGRGYSVLEVIHAYETACGKTLPYVIDERRPGDIAISYCDASYAEKELSWKAQYGLSEMCRDSWNWQKNNPEGYRK